jgi:hypothetical protein
MSILPVLDSFPYVPPSMGERMGGGESMREGTKLIGEGSEEGSELPPISPLRALGALQKEREPC